MCGSNIKVRVILMNKSYKSSLTACGKEKEVSRVQEIRQM